ncbi:hypothetical protein MCOR23_002060 [Pyricularia oryzae]|nr:hypothetical protein MCOR01_010134 [Pyricularia oryzae]KAI6406884.1 hypothetical protein MCOR23_002060 [Pyricularia oryzae]
MVTFTQLFTTFLSVTAVAAVTTHYPAKDRVMIFLSRSDEQPVHARMRLHDLETHYMKDPDFGWKATGYDVLEKQGSWAWLISSKHNGNIELAKKRLAVMGYWDDTYSWGQNPDGSPITSDRALDATQGAGSNTQLLRQQAVTNAVLSGWQQAAVARIEDYGKGIGVE